MSEMLCGDALTILRDRFADESVQCCVTSPPYWGLRDYKVDGQLGLEKTPEEYVAKLVEVFREVRRVLKPDGTLWLNLGDSYCGSWGNSGNRPELDKRTDNQREKTTDYLPRGGWDSRRDVPPNQKIAGLKPKDLVGIPWRVAFALQADGWYLRSDIIWSKPNPMPESVTDRPTKAHEYLFLLAKSERYYYDADAIAEPMTGEAHSPGNRTSGRINGVDNCLAQPDRIWGLSGTRNKRTVWEIATAPYPEAHFATFPPKLIEPCILAGCPSGGLVLDPFAGSGTTLMVAQQLGRRAVGIELNQDYLAMAEARCRQESLMLDMGISEG